MQVTFPSKPYAPAQLAQELAAALPAGWAVQLLPPEAPIARVWDDGAGTLVVLLPEGTPASVQTTVGTAVAAHTPGTAQTAAQQVAQDRADVAALLAAATPAVLTQMDTDLATLAGTVTLLQAVPILRRAVQTQKALARALLVWARRQGGT